MKLSIQALRQRYALLDAAHKRIAHGAAWVFLFVLIGKLAGAVKEMAVAYRYGVSGVVDAYQLATTLVTWLPGTLVSVLSIVLIPMFVRLRQQGADERSEFLREMQGSALVVGIILGAASILFAPFVLPALAGRLSEATRQMAWQFTLGMAPVALLTLLIGIYSARLMARERQANTLLEGVPALIILAFILLWSLGGDIAPLLWGTVLGMTIQTAWLSRLAGQTDGERASPRLSWHSSHWREFKKAAAIMAVGQIAMSCITPLDQYTAAQLGDSAIATLGYANRIIGLLLSLGAMAISRAALPVMADLSALGQAEKARYMALKWAALMLAVGTFVALLAWLLAPWGIALLFERGAFGAQDTLVVTTVFRWGLIQTPFYFAGLVMVQWLASRQQYRSIALVAAANFLIKLALNGSMSSVFGLSGILMATGVMYGFAFICYFSIGYWSTDYSGDQGTGPEITRS